MKPYRLLVFDWDGTLVDSRASIVACMRRALSEAGLEPPADTVISQIIGLGLQEAVARLVPDATPPQRFLVTERYRLHYLRDAAEMVRFFDGAVETLERLREEGYLLGVATGKSRRGLDHALKWHEVTHLFDATGCADESRSKPHPQMLLDLMERLEVGPEGTLVIGDTEFDLLMAANAGVDGVAVTCGAHDQARLLECRPLACLRDVSELPRWLDERAEGRAP
ncbi:MAG: HAD family hydrolase [Gammaproteobacteria bacterium]|nr:MAG: HAD family hydrolase [Gammaproteobacteria bacterium]